MTIEQIEESLFRKGFGKELNAELGKQVSSGNSEIKLAHSVAVEKDEIRYTIHIKNDIENDQLYLNKFDAALKPADSLEEVREHTFSSERMITAMEAYRMLKHGDKVAVNKDLFKDGEKYNTWLSLDLNQPKDEYGNYHVNSYHQNYYIYHPFNVKEQLGKVSLPVKQLENPGSYESMGKSLKKANLIPVDVILNGREQKGYLGVDPAHGQVVLYDSKMQLIKDNIQKQENSQNITATPGNEEVKKSPGAIKR